LLGIIGMNDSYVRTHTRPIANNELWLANLRRVRTYRKARTYRSKMICEYVVESSKYNIATIEEQAKKTLN
jgi:hypothetical protein